MEFEVLYESYPIIESEEIILKKIENEDLDEFYKLHSDKEIFKYIPGKGKNNIKTIGNMIGYYERDFNKKKMIFLGIYVKSPKKKLVGLAEIFDIDRKVEMATIGYRLIPEYWGKGIATKTTELMVAYLFNTIKVNRIQAFVMPENKKSSDVLKRNKFTFEGVLRKGQFWKDKGIVDLEVYSLLSEEYSIY